MDPFNPEKSSPSGAAQRIERYEARRRALVKAGAPAKLEEMAEHLGWSFSSAQRWFAGERKKIAIDEETAVDAALTQMERDYAERLPAHLRVASDNGAGFDGLSPYRAEDQDLRMALRLPVYGMTSPGAQIGLAPECIVDRVRMDEMLAPADHRGQERFLLQVSDADMEPRYFQGERVIVARNRPPRPGEECVIEHADHGLQLKIYNGLRGGRIWFGQYREEPAGDRGAAEPETSYSVHEIAGIHAVLGSLR